MRRALTILILPIVLAAMGLRAASPPRLSASLPASMTSLLPVAVELTVENLGPEVMVLHDFPRIRLIRVEILDESGQSLHKGFLAPTAGPQGESYLKPITLAAGGTYSIQVTLANRWTEEKVLLGPAFPTAGHYKVAFSYSLNWEAAGGNEVTQVRSEPAPLEIVAPTQTQQAAFDRLRRQPHLAWSLEPRAGLRVGNDVDLTAWERDMRDYLQQFPASPWAPVLQYAVASRLYDRASRPGQASSALLDEAASLTTKALAQPSFPYVREASELRRRLERLTPGNATRVQQPAETTDKAAVETELEGLLGDLADGDLEGLRARLHSAFRFNARLAGSEWLQEVATERRALGAEPLRITKNSSSIVPSADAMTVLADLSYEAGARKSSHRVKLTFRQENGSWRLAEWSDEPRPAETR